MTPWILLRGLAREARHWESLPGELSRRTGTEVVPIDLPGNGVLFRERSPSNVESMVAAARAEVARRALQGPVRLLGLSMGAMVAMEWASRHPAEVTGAVLVNVSTRDDGWPWMRLRPTALWNLGRAVCARDAARRERIVLALCSSAPPVAARETAWASYALERPTSAANAFRQLVAAAGFHRPAVCPRVPMLVVASKADRLVSPSCSVRLAREWGLPLRLHASAGHEVALDAAPWLAQVCADWAKGVGDVCHTPVARVMKPPP